MTLLSLEEKIKRKCYETEIQCPIRITIFECPKCSFIMNGFEKREQFGSRYWNDPRWDQVKKLRIEGKNLEANSLTFKIREDYDV